MDQEQTTYRLATRAYSQGDFARANQLCDQLLTRLRTNTDLLNLKAMSCLGMGRVDVAEKAIDRALKVNPHVAGLHLNAALVYQASSQFKQVKRHALEAIRLEPREAPVLYQAAVLCRNCGDYTRALRIVARCLEIQENFPDAWQFEGSTHVLLGDFQAAQKSFEKAVSLQPMNARALGMLVGIRRDELSETNVVAMLKNIVTNSPSAPDRTTAIFSLAGMYRRDQKYGEAFELYKKGNELAANSSPFNLASWQQKLQKVMSETDSLTLSPGSAGQNLVFIVGMPRSGTTLCEQVLGAHPHILACGELATMQHIEAGMERRGINPYAAENQQSGLAKANHDAALQYMSALPRDHYKHQHAVDKAPMNFERIGLIHKVFPAAHFIYCKRHPLDTILSCYFQNFHEGLTFASDLSVITQIYIYHVRMMKHWSARIPERIHTVEYESLVSNLETEARAMTNFLGCDFAPAMLEPHRQHTVVTTASYLQVRRPVYTTSVGKWQDYRSQLEGVIRMLQESDLLDEVL